MKRNNINTNSLYSYISIRCQTRLTPFFLRWYYKVKKQIETYTIINCSYNIVTNLAIASLWAEVPAGTQFLAFRSGSVVWLAADGFLWE